MTDKELLEMAAKAAGIEVEEDAHIPSGGIWLSELDGDKPWSPLTNDGDALRLAVKLSIHVRLWVYACEAEDNNGMSTGLIHASDCGGDVGAATRRAITIAAAEIGKEMP